MLFTWLRRRRRTRLLGSPVPEDWTAILSANVRHWNFLNEQQRTELLKRVRVLISEKDWAGRRGFQVTDEMRVTIAGYASIMLLGVADYYFDDVQTIVVHPSAFQIRHSALSLDENWQPEFHLGQAWHHGPIVLSWKHVLRPRGDGLNVVFHEFAHFLDGLNGEMEGIPPLESREHEKAWYRVTEAEFRRLVGSARRGEATLLDHYGAESRAEFFAVATECFFECPRALRKKHSELYAVLSQFYRQDPAAWLADGQLPEFQTDKPRSRTAGRRSSADRPPTVDEHFTRGLYLLGRERVKSALKEFNQAHVLAPRDSEVLGQRALCYLLLDDFPAARADCLAALALDIRNSEARRVFAALLLETGQTEAAVDELNVVLREQPQDHEAHFLRGRAWLELRSWRHAIDDLGAAILADEHNAEARFCRSVAYRALGNTAAADVDLQAARELDPDIEKT